MVWECEVLIEKKAYTVVVSDEPQALLAAKAAGRAVVGIAGGYAWDMKGITYVVPSREEVTEELLKLVLRRHLGLPWLIQETRRLAIRELVLEDAGRIPEEEYGPEEEIFRNPNTLSLYIKNQYGFYEYGTWALVLRDTGELIGLAGVSNPRLPEDMERCLERQDRTWGNRETLERGRENPEEGEGPAWLELGYHIFRPWRRQGYGREAVAAVMGYSHEVLGARLCALVHSGNLPSCRVAEGLGMRAVMKSGPLTGSFGEQLLYLEPPLPEGGKYGTTWTDMTAP